MATVKQIQTNIIDGDTSVKSFKGCSYNSGVYIVKSGEFYKIGRTVNLLNRMDALQGGNPHETLQVIFWITCPEAVLLEKSLHERFAHKLAFRREWFKLSDEDLRDCIEHTKEWWAKLKT